MPPRNLPPSTRTAPPGIDPEDYDTIREAVMETRRGRWFLDEYASRLRNAETAALQESLGRIEAAMTSQHDELMQRLAAALGSAAAAEAEAEPPFAASEETGEARLAPRHMRYFRADEELFEPAPEATIAAVPRLIDTLPPEPKAPEPPRRRIVITRRKPGEPFEVPLAEDLPKAS